MKKKTKSIRDDDDAVHVILNSSADDVVGDGSRVENNSVWTKMNAILLKRDDSIRLIDSNRRHSTNRFTFFLWKPSSIEWAHVEHTKCHMVAMKTKQKREKVC